MTLMLPDDTVIGTGAIHRHWGSTGPQIEREVAVIGFVVVPHPEGPDVHAVVRYVDDGSFADVPLHELGR